VRKYYCVLLLCVVLLFTQDAFAHKVKIFATAEGNMVTGTVYFPGGGKAQNVIVSVLDAKDNHLGQTVTDDIGKFAYTIQHNCGHIFLVDTGDGHRARFIIEREELSGDMSELGNLCTKDSCAAVLSEQPLTEEIISKIVSRQVRPLREQLEQYEETIRMRDIIGGIGYIVGIMGLLALFLKKKDK